MIRRFLYGIVFCLLILGFVVAIDSFFLAQSALHPQNQPLAAVETYAQEFPVTHASPSTLLKSK